jgi:hypothetical protein
VRWPASPLLNLPFLTQPEPDPWLGEEHRFRFLEGKAESVPLPSESVAPAVSRGSIFFWECRPLGIPETYRVLRPGSPDTFRDWATQAGARDFEDIGEGGLGENDSQPGLGVWLIFRKGKKI